MNNILTDCNGKYSATRVTMLLWGLGVLVVWGYASFKAGALIAIPDSVVTMCGVTVGGKVVQSFAENKAAPPVPK